VDGIADIGFALIAWCIDPGKKCVGMIQLKQEGAGLPLNP